MSIQQLNGSYIDTEDRLLFRFTTSANEEYRLWLTRRITGALLSYGEKLAIASLEEKHALSVAKVVDQFQQDKLASAVQPAAAFAGKSQLPLGANPVLVHHVEFPGGDPDLTSILLVLSNQQRLTLRLKQGEFDHLRSLLLQLWKKSPWGDEPALGPPAQPPAPRSLH